MTPEERQALLKSLDEYAEQVEHATLDGDAGSLERGAAINRLYEDREWWAEKLDELAPLKIKTRGGVALDPYSKNRFVEKWLCRKDAPQTKMSPRQCRRLVKADDMLTLYKVAAPRRESLSGESAVHPLYRLKRYGLEDETKRIIGRAYDLAVEDGGNLVTSKHVSQAVRMRIAEIPKPDVSKRVGRSSAEVASSRAKLAIDKMEQAGEPGLLSDVTQYALAALKRAEAEAGLKNNPQPELRVVS